MYQTGTGQAWRNLIFEPIGFMNWRAPHSQETSGTAAVAVLGLPAAILESLSAHFEAQDLERNQWRTRTGIVKWITVMPATCCGPQTCKAERGTRLGQSRPWRLAARVPPEDRTSENWPQRLPKPVMVVSSEGGGDGENVCWRFGALAEAHWKKF